MYTRICIIRVLHSEHLALQERSVNYFVLTARIYIGRILAYARKEEVTLNHRSHLLYARNETPSAMR